MNGIVVEHLRKDFTVYRRDGRVRRQRTVVHAVADISFTVAPGEMVGYIGPNGAGKSTTIKMLTGILVPSAGRVEVAGLEPSRRRVELARRIGVVFGQRSQLWWDLPLADSFRLLRHLYAVEPAAHAEQLAECTELLDLAPLLDVPVRQLSLGQRMRGELTAALLHRPDVLFLDEPTIGLDIVSKARVRTFLTELNRNHATTVLLTTHDLDDVERLCSRLAVVDQGRVVFDGSIDALRERFGAQRTLVVDLAEAVAPIAVDGARVVKVDGPRQWLEFQRDAITAADLIARVSALVDVRDLTIEEPAIDDIVARLGGGSDRG